MRNLTLFFMAMFLGTTATFASTADDKVAERNAYRYNNSFIFLEDGITFAVYPDGEFDFYIDSRIGRNRRNVTFNSGFDYSPFAQYDDYGAVIQVENIPVYYDFYGRVSQIGSVDINYRNGRVNRLGNMFVYYNRRGFYDYHTGFINVYNRSYIYRPFHSFFARPALGFCFVRTTPYRRYYNPFRYTYYNPYRFNRRQQYARIGKVHRYNQVRRERSSIYRNDKRVAVRDNARRSNRTVARNSARGNRNVARSSEARRTDRSTARANSNRGNRTVARTSTTRSNGTNRAVKRTDYRRGTAANSRTVTKREVTRTPRSTTVKRSTSTTVRKPVSRGNKTYARGNTSNRTQRSVARPTQRTSRSTVSRSTTSRSVKKAPARSSRSNRSATTSRSRGRQ
ncbi:hypothetical protein [Maribacter sp.]